MNIATDSDMAAFRHFHINHCGLFHQYCMGLPYKSQHVLLMYCFLVPEPCEHLVHEGLRDFKLLSHARPCVALLHLVALGVQGWVFQWVCRTSRIGHAAYCLLEEVGFDGLLN